MAPADAKLPGAGEIIPKLGPNGEGEMETGRNRSHRWDRSMLQKEDVAAAKEAAADCFPEAGSY